MDNTPPMFFQKAGGFAPDQHNGFPPEEVVMQQANKRRDGAFDLAPGYG